MREQLKENLKFLIKEYGSLKTAYQMMLDKGDMSKINKIDCEIEKIKKEINKIIEEL